MSILNKIVEFNKKCNKMEYIIPNNGNIITQIKESDYYKYYKMLSPEEFLKYNGGVCWDYVTYEATYFKHNFPSVKYKTFYILLYGKAPDDLPTHTVLLFYFGRKVYWFESSWKLMGGVHMYQSEVDVLKDIVYKMIKGNQSKILNYRINQYNALDSNLIGLTCTKYYNYMDKLKIYMEGSADSVLPYYNELDSANEGYVFSKKDTEYRVDDFTSGKENVLLITGLSRSGKSTLAGNFAMDFPTAQIISLDVIENLNVFIEQKKEISYLNPCLKSFFKSNLGKEILKYYKEIGYIPDDILSEIMKEVIEWILKYAKEHSPQPFVIEGLQLFLDADFDTIKDYPMIIKNTSMLKSFLRRENKNMNTFRMYIDSEKALKSFRRLEKLHNMIKEM